VSDQDKIRGLPPMNQFLKAIKTEAEWRLVDRINEDFIRGCMMPASVLNPPDSNYSSAAATSAAFSARLGSAEDIEKAIRDAGEITKDSKPRSLRGAYLVVPPDTYHQMTMGPMFLESPEIEEGPIRFRTFMDYGVRMPIYRSMLLRDADWPIEARYKPRPLPEPAQNVPAWQYVVAVAAGVLILSMMFSAVGAL